MRCEITDTKEHDKAFAVCIIPVPSFPTNDKISDVVREPLLAVVGATCDDNGWSFVSLDRDDKHCIGDELVRLGVEENVWKYCTLYSV